MFGKNISWIMNTAKDIGPYIIVIMSIFITVILLKYLNRPYIWVSLTWFILGIYLLRYSSKLWVKRIWLSVAAISITIGLLELYYETVPEPIDHSKFRGHELTEYSSFSDVLGHVPMKNTVKPVEMYYGDEIVYSATYSTDEKGIRVSPPNKFSKNSDQQCVVFFGGSFTFGHGVNDEETLPYLVSLISEGKYRTFNLGFNGWGAHQMLAMLEHNLEKDALDCEPKYAIYQAIVNHVDRAIGLGSWDKHGPRYQLMPDGELILAGDFDDGEKAYRNINKMVDSGLVKILLKSKMFRTIAPRVLNTLNRNSYINLYLAIVGETKIIFESRYPGSKFYVILWDDPKFSDSSVNKILKGLRGMGIKVFLVSEMLPEYRKRPGDYQLSPYDRHPAPIAYKLISEYTLQNILE